MNVGKKKHSMYILIIFLKPLLILQALPYIVAPVAIVVGIVGYAGESFLTGDETIEKVCVSCVLVLVSSLNSSLSLSVYLSPYFSVCVLLSSS